MVSFEVIPVPLIESPVKGLEPRHSAYKATHGTKSGGLFPSLSERQESYSASQFLDADAVAEAEVVGVTRLKQPFVKTHDAPFFFHG